MKPLEDITVLSCEQFEAGTAATYAMAFQGATIIVVEPPGRGQVGRYAIGYTGPNIDSWYHIYLTMNKKSITLNLATPKGVEIFREMCKKVDVVHDNMGPATMKKLGIDFDTLRKINPRLIGSTIKGFGEGPYEKYLCMDGVAQAVGTSYSQTGYPDKPPISPGPSLGDTGTGMFSTGAIMAAIYQRDITGEGQFVEVAMADCCLNYNRANLALKQAEKDPMFTGPAIPRTGNRLPGVAPFNSYLTKDSADKDNYLVVVAREQKQWDALLRVIGRTDLVGDPKYKDCNARWQYVDEIDKIIEAWSSQRGAEEAFLALANAGVPAAFTQNSTQVMSNPHYIARDMVVEVEHPLRGRYKTLGSVAKLSDTGKITYTYGPLLGQHNAEVYAKYMGYTSADLTKLQAEGVI